MPKKLTNQEIKKDKKNSSEKPQYDYLNGNKHILSADRKHFHVVIIPGFSDNSFLEMGSKGYLTGEALKDYNKMEESI